MALHPLTREVVVIVIPLRPIALGATTTTTTTTTSPPTWATASNHPSLGTASSNRHLHPLQGEIPSASTSLFIIYHCKPHLVLSRDSGGMWMVKYEQYCFVTRLFIVNSILFVDCQL